MDFQRTKDFELVQRILTLPEIYPLIGDDYTPPVERFKLNEHPGIWYVIVRNADFRKVGMFTLFPLNHICWECHVVMLPEARTRDKWCAARQLVPWLKQHTECERLTAAVPSCNRKAIVYGMQGIGMRYVGRHPKAFRKWGELQDLVLLGIGLNGESTCRV